MKPFTKLKPNSRGLLYKIWQRLIKSDIHFQDFSQFLKQYKIIFCLVFVLSSCYTTKPIRFADEPYKYTQDAFKCDSTDYFSNFQGTRIYKAKNSPYKAGDTLIFDNDLETFCKLKEIK